MTANGRRPIPAPPQALARVDPADRVLALALGLMMMALAFPHRARIFISWDSVLFGLGIEDYDFVRARPHPPAYPLYVAAGKVLTLATHDPNASLVWISLATAGAAVGLTYLLLREFVGQVVAAAGAGLLAIAPNFAYGSMIGLSYMPECLMSVGLAWVAWRARRQPPGRAAFTLSAVFAVALGVRPSSLFFLTPLFLWGLLTIDATNGFSLRRWMQAAAAGAAVCLLWAAPAAFAGGGLGAWIRTTGRQSKYIVYWDTFFNHGWPAVERHVAVLWPFVVSERPIILIIGLLAALWLAARLPRGHLPPWRVPRSAVFILVWALPSILFYVFVFVNGPRGYTLVFLPAVYVAFAVSADRATRAVASFVRWPLERNGSPHLVGIVVPLLIVLAPATGLLNDTRDLVDTGIVGYERHQDAWLDLLRETPNASTVILADDSYEFAKWYAPEHAVYIEAVRFDDFHRPVWSRLIEARHHEDDVAIFDLDVVHSVGPMHPLPAAGARVIVMDAYLRTGDRAVIGPAVTLHEARLEDGTRYWSFDVPAGNHTLEEYLLTAPRDD